MTPTHQHQKPQSSEGRLKLIATALPVFAGLAYPIGFLLLNVVYSMWGFTDFHVLHVQCFLVAAWICAMTLGCSLAILLILSIEGGKLSHWFRSMLNSKRAPIAFFFALLLAASVWYWWAHHPNAIRSLVTTNLKSLYFLIIASAGCVTLILPVGLVQDQKHKRLSDVTLSEWLGGVMGIVVSTLLFSVTFFFMPASWGGGIPELKTYLVPPVAVPYLAPYNRSAQLAAVYLAKLPVGAAPVFVRIEGLSLIHEGSDRIVLMSEPCKKLLRLPKEWFDKDAWNAPNPNVPEAQKEADMSRDCPANDATPKATAAGTVADGTRTQAITQP